MRKISLVAALAVAGCAAAPVQPPVMGGKGSCRNEALASFIGQPASSDVGARMLAASGARVIRWVAMGMMVTMDYRADRLTVHLAADNRIMSASCG